MKYDLMTEIKAKSGQRYEVLKIDEDSIREITKGLTITPNSVKINNAVVEISVPINKIVIRTNEFDQIEVDKKITNNTEGELSLVLNYKVPCLSAYLKNSTGIYFLKKELETNKLSIRFYDQKAVETLERMTKSLCGTERTYTYNGIIPDDEYEIEVEGNIYQIANQILTTDMITKEKGKARTRTN